MLLTAYEKPLARNTSRIYLQTRPLLFDALVMIFGCVPLFIAIWADPAKGGDLELSTEELVTNLVKPVDIAVPDDGTDRLFIAEQGGAVRVWNGSEIEPAPYLDLTSSVTVGNEAGLLGIVFHPNYADTGEFFVNYTRSHFGQLQTVISRFSVSDTDPSLADSDSEDILLIIDQPATNHNAGDLAFGPYGYLYIPTGDGGGAGDPNENAQDIGTLLGKVLRIDVDSTPDPGLAYAIPPDNPFVDQPDARHEIWASGLRNPFRFSFDRVTGDLWIGDVGQNAWEEINLQSAGSNGGENYGWDCREGGHDYTGIDNDDLLGCMGQTFTDPVLEYPHVPENNRCSVTGGFRYRGSAHPTLRGVYLFADFCTGEIFGTVPRCDTNWESQLLLNTPFNITTFGEDADGELYITERVNTSNPDSAIHRLLPADDSGGPALVPSPTALNFGPVETGDTVTLILSLENNNSGPEAALVSSHALSDPGQLSVDFTRGPKPCQSGGLPCRAPGNSCTLGVSLKADAPAGISESLTFKGNFENTIIAVEATAMPCSSHVNLTFANATINASDGPVVHRACDTLTGGPNVTVNPGGELTLRAGTLIILQDGFRIEKGGKLALEIF